MACCTTISPVSSPKKRGASSMFELPRSAKRRRPGLASLGTTMLTTSLGPSASSPGLFTNMSGGGGHQQQPSSCFDVNVPYTNPLEDDSSSSSDTDDIMHRIKKEAKRLIKRKQPDATPALIPLTANALITNLDANNNAPPTTLKSSPCKLASAASAISTSPLLSNIKRKEVPLFTLSQVNAICDKMVKEREAAIREQYDKILAQKLSEQYDAFVKFTHEQIQRRFENSQCSYVS